MHIENSFTVDAPADRVFAFLLEVNSVLGCVPGAELSEIVDADTFRGRVRIRVGPISVAYQGTGHIVSRDDHARTAVLEAEGREAGGSGSARAAITVRVADSGVGIGRDNRASRAYKVVAAQSVWASAELSTLVDAVKAQTDGGGDQVTGEELGRNRVGGGINSCEASRLLSKLP